MNEPDNTVLGMVEHLDSSLVAGFVQHCCTDGVVFASEKVVIST